MLPMCVCCLPTCPICGPLPDFTAEELAEAEMDAIPDEECEPWGREKCEELAADVVRYHRERDEMLKRMREGN